MSDENPEAIQPIPPLGVSGPPAVLSVQQDQISLNADGITMHLRLEDILSGAAASKNPVPPLLYALVLKLCDVDNSLRRLATTAEGQVAKQTEMTGDPAKLVTEILGALRESGLTPDSIGKATGTNGAL